MKTNLKQNSHVDGDEAVKGLGKQLRPDTRRIHPNSGGSPTRGLAGRIVPTLEGALSTAVKRREGLGTLPFGQIDATRIMRRSTSAW